MEDSEVGRKLEHIEEFYLLEPGNIISLNLGVIVIMVPAGKPRPRACQSESACDPEGPVLSPPALL